MEIHTAGSLCKGSAVSLICLRSDQAWSQWSVVRQPAQAEHATLSSAHHLVRFNLEQGRQQLNMGLIVRCPALPECFLADPVAAQPETFDLGLVVPIAVLAIPVLWGASVFYNKRVETQRLKALGIGRGVPGTLAPDGADRPRTLTLRAAQAS